MQRRGERKKEKKKKENERAYRLPRNHGNDVHARVLEALAIKELAMNWTCIYTFRGIFRRFRQYRSEIRHVEIRPIWGSIQIYNVKRTVGCIERNNIFSVAQLTLKRPRRVGAIVKMKTLIRYACFTIRSLVSKSNFKIDQSEDRFRFIQCETHCRLYWKKQYILCGSIKIEDLEEQLLNENSPQICEELVSRRNKKEQFLI